MAIFKKVFGFWKKIFCETVFAQNWKLSDFLTRNNCQSDLKKVTCVERSVRLLQTAWHQIIVVIEFNEYRSSLVKVHIKRVGNKQLELIIQQIQ